MRPLDHVHDFLGNASFDSTNPAMASLSLFFTRYVTHLCAPMFVFLAGVGARLSLGSRTPGGVAAFMVKRGFWLLLLEASVIDQAWIFGQEHELVFQVIGTLGLSMILLATLSFLPILSCVS